MASSSFVTKPYVMERPSRRNSWEAATRYSLRSIKRVGSLTLKSHAGKRESLTAPPNATLRAANAVIRV